MQSCVSTIHAFTLQVAVRVHRRGVPYWIAADVNFADDCGLQYLFASIRQ